VILERIKSLARIISILNVIAKNLKLYGHGINIAPFLMRAYFIAFLLWRGLIALRTTK
jgi:hypothetical protein